MNDKKDLKGGYQPLQKGYKPQPISNQTIKPPKGGTGETQTSDNNSKEK